LDREDYCDSMPGLPPVRAGQTTRIPQFNKGDLVRCVDASDRAELTKGKDYEIDCWYTQDTNEDYYYLKGLSANTPFKGSRFVGPINTATQAVAHELAASIPLGDLPELGSPIFLKETDQVALENTLAGERMGAAVAGDNVTLPAHYARFKIEPIRFICENGLNFFQGNIVKYTVRHDAKNGVEDIRKAIRYATMYREYLLGNPDWWRIP
jgi:hypothetical protein